MDKSETLLDKIEYDGAGRVQHWTTPDARIDYDGFTLDGLPQSTTQTRFKNHSGLSSADVLDQFSQTHGYNGHGERTSYSVPGGGGTPRWSTSVTVQYDAMGNIATLTTDGGLSLTGDYRAAGRPNSRTITLPVTSGAPKMLARTYTYKPGTGQLQEMKATIGNTDVAGSTVAYDGLLVNDATLIGVSGGLRHTRHTYDKRGCLGGSVVAASADAQAPPPGAAASSPGSTAEAPDPADFRTGQSRAPLLDPAVASLLQSRGIDTSAIDPPSQTAVPAGGHKIETFTRGTTTRTFNFATKSELVDDGLFHYHYDQKGRLDWAAEKATATGVVIRRILYTYDGNNRLVGRTAQAATVTSLTASYDTFTWNLEIRPEVIAIDGIPAETTFVWDPVSDRIITVVRAGDSKLPSDPNNNVLKQIIHGDMGYDDPLEVTTVDTSAFVAPGQPQPVTKLYPIYDEAAGGTLQVVVNRNGEVVARSVNNDPFGGAEFDLAGAAIDHVEVQAAKNAQGGLDSVVVTMRATEQLTAASVASGSRLAVVDVSGNLVRTSSTTATLATSDPYTVKWTLSATDWATLSDPAAVNGKTPVSLSIAATSTLRAALWKVDLPILPAPDWATASKPVFSSSTLPVEVRESLNALSTTISALNAGDSKTTVSYDIANLGLLGTSGSNADVATMLAATFQAQPFAEPFTRKFYVRERWYDPTTGTWLTPDPLGYKDSANLYSYAGGDPVNKRDPVGTRSMTAADKNHVKQLINRLHWLQAQRAKWKKTKGAVSFATYKQVYLRPDPRDSDWVAGASVIRPATVLLNSDALFDEAQRVIQDDIASFNEAVVKADDDAAIYYVPGQGFVTSTKEQQSSARFWGGFSTAIAGAEFFAMMAVPETPGEVVETELGDYEPENLKDVEASNRRAEDFEAFWPKASVRDAIERLAGGDNAIVTVTPTGKVIYRNPATGVEVVYDRVSDYFTVISPTGEYLDINGNSIPKNVPLVGGKKTTMTGTPPLVRKAVVHYRNTDYRP